MAEILSPLLTAYKIAKALIFKNDYVRWHKVSLVAPPWDERNKIIGTLIPGNCAVLDVGCGSQTLKRHLPDDVKYQPCDLVKREGVLFCDFNSGVYPAIDTPFDYVVCSGVMEYARNPSEFLQRVGGLGKTMILTYCHRSPGDKTWQRIAAGWKNHFTKEQIESLFDDEGFTWTTIGEWGLQRIYSMTRKHK